jgi:FAD synthase
MCALSIGWNPVYDNPEKTIEVYIMHDFGDLDFYGEHFEIDLKSFMRAEALFPTFDDLILAIHCDVEAAK